MVRKAVKRWEDNQITGIGRRNARTSFYKDSQKRMSLNGQWAFLYLDAPELSPEGFEQPEPQEGWDQIDVPSVWQLRGYDRGTIQMYCIRSRSIRLMFRMKIQPEFIKEPSVWMKHGWKKIRY